MKMVPIVSSETSVIRTQTPGNYPKRNKLHLEHGESLKTRSVKFVVCTQWDGNSPIQTNHITSFYGLFRMDSYFLSLRSKTLSLRGRKEY